MDELYTIWGTPHSLYTGKIRSYLIKKGIAYEEIMASDPNFVGDIIRQVGLKVIPVMRAPDGEIIQDTTAMIDHIESRVAAPSFVPSGPVQRIVADLIDAFGSNYLMAIAMHYRWSYREQQEHFLCNEFSRAVPAPTYIDRMEKAGKLMSRFADFLPNLGVTPEVIPAMEASYKELLALLEIHFQNYPYFLGGCPSAADFGMMAPLYAHLARDPVPAFLMKTTAPSVYRWTERMNMPGLKDGDFKDLAIGFPEDDALPETLEPILAFLFSQWGPGLKADVACFDAWVDGLEAPDPGTLVSHDGRRQVHPHVGRVSYAWRDVVMQRASQPHALWHFERARTAAPALTGVDRERLDALLERTGGNAMMALTTKRKIARNDNVLVLA
ncbi:Gst Glutathione S-transferase [Caulobacteraceae bacterium]